MFTLDMLKKLKKGYVISWGILGVLFFYMFSLNFLMPLHRDDYEYSLVWGTFQKLTSMSDVFHSLYLHYFTHGGRMVDFFVLDSFLLWGKEWFNPFNAFLFVALIVLIYWHSQQKITLRFNPCILSLIIAFCWFGLPDFALVNIWMTGACVYLLTSVLIFSFLLPYHFDFLGKPIFRDGFLACLGMFFAGIIASWTIENTAATMNLIVVLFVGYAYKKSQLKKWMVTGCIGSILGFLLLVLAPGNYVRYAEQKTPFIRHILNQFGGGFELFLGLLPAILFFVLAYRVLLVAYKKRNRANIISINRSDSFVRSSVIRIGFIVLMLVSKMNMSFFSLWVSNLLYNNIVLRLGRVDEHLKEQMFTALSGLEEVLIYLLIIVQLTKYIFRKWKLRKVDLQKSEDKGALQTFLSIHPVCRSIAALVALTIINNLAMMAAPAFPGRAAFGSAVFFIIAVMSFFAIPKVQEFFLSDANKKSLLIGAALTVIPMALAVLYQHEVLYEENSLRMAQVEAWSAQGMEKVELEPVSLKNELLRHVYFVELNNSVSKYGFCRYYKFKELHVLPKKHLADVPEK